MHRRSSQFLTKRDVVYDVFRSRKDQRWEHAEQFLEFVDLAVDAASPKFKILTWSTAIDR